MLCHTRSLGRRFQISHITQAKCGSSLDVDDAALARYEEEVGRSRELGWLALIVGAALAIRLAGIGANPSGDEGYSWLVAHAPSWGSFIQRIAAYENTPPLFYVLLRPLPANGVEWLRLPALIPSLLTVVATYFAARRLLSVRTAQFAALALAVAPFAVSFADYSRGFMLAGCGLTFALWAAVELGSGGRRVWWVLWLVGATVAVYSEYYAVVFLLPLAGLILATKARPQIEVLLFAALPILAFLPWLGELEHGLDAVNVTKVVANYPAPGAGSIRNVLTTLVFGDLGTTAPVIRWVELLVVLAVVVVGVRALTRTLDQSARQALWFFPGLAAAVLVLTALVALVGPHVFGKRYLTPVIPLFAILLGAGLASTSRRVQAIGAVALALVGAAVGLRRAGRAYQPSVNPVRTFSSRQGPRTVLTNSAVLAYALRDLPVRLDRPFNLGRGEQDRCRRRDEFPVLIADDQRLGRARRIHLGEGRRFGPFAVKVRTVAAATSAGCPRGELR